MKNVQELLDLWPDYSEIAADCKVTKDAVWQWVKRDYIPPGQNRNLLKSAELRGFTQISHEVLAALNVPPICSDHL